LQYKYILPIPGEIVSQTMVAHPSLTYNTAAIYVYYETCNTFNLLVMTTPKVFFIPDEDDLGPEWPPTIPPPGADPSACFSDGSDDCPFGGYTYAIFGEGPEAWLCGGVEEDGTVLPDLLYHGPMGTNRVLATSSAFVFWIGEGYSPWVHICDNGIELEPGILGYMCYDNGAMLAFHPGSRAAALIWLLGIQAKWGIDPDPYSLWCEEIPEEP
jgi:hypothetical protein